MYLAYVFWFVAGVMSGAAAALVLARSLRQLAPPIAGRLPLGSALLGAAGIGVVVGLYLWLGRPESIGSAPAQPAVPRAAAAVPDIGAVGAEAGSMDAAVAGLEARLARGPGSDADWKLLAQSYEFLGRGADAARARSKQLPATRTVVAAPAQLATPAVRTAGTVVDAAARELVSQANAARRARSFATARQAYVKLAARGAMTADTWADYADVTASLQGGSLAGEPEKHIAAALQLDPRHAKALWLRGSMLHAAGRYTEAVATWEQLATVFDPQSSDARLIAANIAEDVRLGGAASAPKPGTARLARAPAAAGAAVSGEVVVADTLKSRVSAGQAVFIYARAVDAPGPPVAALRTTTGQWPLRFRLDDAASMLPTRPLSAAGRVIIEARISKNGQVLAAAGDLRGASTAVDPKNAGALRIVIDRVVN